jgi:hypothetical protein
MGEKSLYVFEGGMKESNVVTTVIKRLEDS